MRTEETGQKRARKAKFYLLCVSFEGFHDAFRDESAHVSCVKERKGSVTIFADELFFNVKY